MGLLFPRGDGCRALGETVVPKNGTTVPPRRWVPRPRGNSCPEEWDYCSPAAMGAAPSGKQLSRRMGLPFPRGDGCRALGETVVPKNGTTVPPPRWVPRPRGNSCPEEWDYRSPTALCDFG